MSPWKAAYSYFLGSRGKIFTQALPENTYSAPCKNPRLLTWSRSRGRALPVADIGTAGPGLCRGQRAAFLQQLNRDIVGAAHKGHAAITRRAVDGDAIGLQMGAGGVDVIHLIGEVSE